MIKVHLNFLTEKSERIKRLTAVKYPDAINQPYKNDIMLLQNIFVHIFSILFEDDEILKYKAQPTTFKPKLRKKTPMRDGAIKNGLIMYGLATF